MKVILDEYFLWHWNNAAEVKEYATQIFILERLPILHKQYTQIRFLNLSAEVIVCSCQKQTANYFFLMVLFVKK